MKRVVDNHAMIKYIKETEKYALHIIEERKLICKEFIDLFTKKQHEHIILVGSGTSYNTCLTAKHFFEKILKMHVLIYTSYDFSSFKTYFTDKDFVVFVTQEGESTNTIEAIKTANHYSLDNVVLTENKDNTCSQIAKGKVVLDCECECFGPKTKGYTCTVLSLYLMALEAGLKKGTISENEYDKYIEKMTMTVNNIPTVIESSEQYLKEHLQELIECDHAYVIGYGPHVGTALEGALKSLETVRDFYFSFETEEFLHGPLSSVKPNVYTFIIAAKNQGYDRSVALYEAMYKYNNHTYLIGTYDGEFKDHVINTNFIDDLYMSVLEYIIPLQLLAYYTFTGKGRDLNYRNYPQVSNVISTKSELFKK